MRRLILGQLRQVHQYRVGRSEHDRARQRGRTRIAGRQIVGRAVLADRFHSARLGICDGDETELDLPPVMGEPDHVGGIERQPRGRKAEGRALAPGPGFEQSAAASAFRLFRRNGHRETLRCDPRRVDGDAPRLDERGVVILIGARQLPFQRLRQLGLLAPRQFQHVTLASGNQIVGRDGGDRRPAA